MKTETLFMRRPTHRENQLLHYNDYGQILQYDTDYTEKCSSVLDNIVTVHIRVFFTEQEKTVPKTVR